MKPDSKIFEAEEEEAMNRNPVEDLQRFHSSCEFIKSCIGQMKVLKTSTKDTSQEMQSVHIDAVTQFMEMKKLNRLAHFRCRTAREATNDAKHKIDQCHLTLQNLLYEVMHLQKEITKCMEFKSKDEEIELVSLEAFYADAPESLSNPTVTKEDSHQQTLARLEWELEQRKQLSSKLKEMDDNKEKITQDIKSKEDYLETLGPKLSAILSATRPVQDYLDIPYDAIKEEHEKAKYLSPPLYILYMQLSAYKEACDKQLKVSIEGDVEAAKSMVGQSVELEEDSDSDNEEHETGENNEDNRRKSTDRRKEKRNRILQKHPLTVGLEIRLEDGTKLHLSFNSLPGLKILTVDVKVVAATSPGSVNSISGGDLLSPDLLLDELYPGDHGNDSPNVANNYELSKHGLGTMSSFISTLGRPYLWCQWLGGLQFLTKEVDSGDNLQSSSQSGNGDNGENESGAKKTKEVEKREVVQAKHSISSNHMEETIKRLKKRLRSRVTLVHHISSIERGILPISKELTALFPAKINAKLSAWRRSTFEDLCFAPQTQSAIQAGIIRPTDFVYTAHVERGSAKLTAYVIITADCPMVTPFFVLDIMWQKRRNALNDIHIMEMEEELNMHHNELILNKSSRDFLLAAQLQRLLMCFDIYLETEGSASTIMPVEFHAEKVLPRTTRGPSRSKPYKYVPEFGIFTQRMV